MNNYKHPVRCNVCNDIMIDIMADVIDDYQKENQQLKTRLAELEKQVQFDINNPNSKAQREAMLKTVQANNKQLTEEKEKLVITVNELRAKLKVKEATIDDMANKIIDNYTQISYWQTETKRLENKLTNIMNVIQGKK